MHGNQAKTVSVFAPLDRNAAPSAGGPTPASGSIAEMIQMLQDQMGRLEKAVVGLEDRIRPVLRPATEANPPRAWPEANSEVGITVSQAALHASRLEAIVASMIDRVDL